MARNFRNTCYRRPAADDLSAVIRLRRVVQLNWFGRICIIAGPLALIISLMATPWIPITLGFPTYVVGAVSTLLLLGLANLNTSVHLYS